MCADSKTSVVLDFCQLQTKPSPKLVKKFIAELNVHIESLLGLQIQSGRRAIIEFASSAAAAAILNKRLVYQGNKIPIYLDDDAMDVYVHNLPLGMSNEDIAKAMSHYGEVLTISNERWVNFFPGIINGVRMLRVLFKKAPPKHLTVMNKIGTVKCNGKPPICRLNAKKKDKQSNEQQTKGEEQRKVTSGNGNQSNNSSNNNNDNSSLLNTADIAENEDNNKDNNSLIKEAETEDNEGFATVITKNSRKNRKRQLREEETRNSKQVKENSVFTPGPSKEDYKINLFEIRRKKIEEKDKIKMQKLSEDPHKQQINKRDTWIQKLRSELDSLKSDLASWKEDNSTSDEDV